MGVLLARLLISVFATTLPFLIFTGSHKNQAVGLVMLVPLFGAIPAAVVALLIFRPIELVLDANGMSHWSEIVIPFVSANLIFLSIFLLDLTQSRSLSKAISNTKNAISTKPWLWIGTGLVFGVCWRASYWLFHPERLAA